MFLRLFCLLSLWLISTGFAAAQEDAVVEPVPTTLTLLHGEEVIGGIDVFFLRPWIRSLGAATDGQLLVSSGPTEDGLNAARRGEADLVLIQVDLPAAEVFHQPFLTHGPAADNASAAWMFTERHIAPVLTDMTVLGAFLHGPVAIHARNRRIRTVADFGKLPMIAPNPTAAQFLTELGARARSGTESQAIRALVRRETEAILAPWDRVPPLEMLRHSRAHAEPIGAVGITNALSILAIANRSFTPLPEDMQQALHAKSGIALSAWMARAADQGDELGRAAIERIPTTEIRIAAEDVATMRTVGEKVTADWVATREAEGFPASVWLYDAQRMLGAN